MVSSHLRWSLLIRSETSLTFLLQSQNSSSAQISLQQKLSYQVHAQLILLVLWLYRPLLAHACFLLWYELSYVACLNFLLKRDLMASLLPRLPLRDFDHLKQGTQSCHQGEDESFYLSKVFSTWLILDSAGSTLWYLCVTLFLALVICPCLPFHICTLCLVLCQQNLCLGVRLFGYCLRLVDETVPHHLAR